MNFFFGFSYWKHGFVEPFFDQKPIFINAFFGQDYLKKALQKGLNKNSKIFIWGRKSFPDIEAYAYENMIPIYRVEDGFVRSVALGSDLTQPYSLVVDGRGIYFDPMQESDLEFMLRNHPFTSEEIARARRIREYMIDKKLSKYNLYENTILEIPKKALIVVVPGQVEDDASIRYGAEGMNNLELLRQVRQNRPEAYIVYKPHPDVLSGNRIGNVEENEAYRYCDKIVSEVGIDTVLSVADEVHTMTSLVGFEALMRGINVVTYGLPFYAGWGLSEDSRYCERRGRRLSIDELVAAVLILYPRYLDPITLKRCEIETVLDYLDRQRTAYRHSMVIRIRNWIGRKVQTLLRMLLQR